MLKELSISLLIAPGFITVGLWTPPKDPEDPPVDPDVDVGRPQDLAVAVPHARPRRFFLPLLWQHSEAGEDIHKALCKASLHFIKAGLCCNGVTVTEVTKVTAL